MIGNYKQPSSSSSFLLAPEAEFHRALRSLVVLPDRLSLLNGLGHGMYLSEEGFLVFGRFVSGALWSVLPSSPPEDVAFKDPCQPKQDSSKIDRWFTKLCFNTTGHLHSCTLNRDLYQHLRIVLPPKGVVSDSHFQAILRHSLVCWSAHLHVCTSMWPGRHTPGFRLSTGY